MLYLFFFTPDRLRAAFYAAGAFFLISPTAHPWYLLLATILLPFYRSRPWILLHLTVGFAALVNIRYLETGAWKESPLLWAAEYVPVCRAWAVGLCPRRIIRAGPVRAALVSLHSHSDA